VHPQKSTFRTKVETLPLAFSSFQSFHRTASGPGVTFSIFDGVCRGKGKKRDIRKAYD
jgi:hypothetical protein